MSEDKEKDPDNTKTEDNNNSSNDEIMIPKYRFDEINTQLQATKKQLNEMVKNQEKAAKEALKEQAEWKTLAEQYEKELLELRPLADKIGGYEESLQGLLEQQVKEIPENMRNLIPNELPLQKQLDWIANNRGLLLKPVAPDVDAHKRDSGDGGRAQVQLTDDEKAVAQSFGMTNEEYSKFLNDQGDNFNQGE